MSSRDVAQPGRAQRSGRWGRWFKSSRPDHFKFFSISIHPFSEPADSFSGPLLLLLLWGDLAP